MLDMDALFVLLWPRMLPVLVDDRVGGEWSSWVCLKGSCLRFGKGGRKGDIEIEVTLAECAWYTRKDCKRGKDITCLTRSARGAARADMADLRRFRYVFRQSV
jgi:hypothetical protein